VLLGFYDGFLIIFTGRRWIFSSY